VRGEAYHSNELDLELSLRNSKNMELPRSYELGLQRNHNPCRRYYRIIMYRLIPLLNLYIIILAA
jgi:hypothetical protein